MRCALWCLPGPWCVTRKMLDEFLDELRNPVVFIYVSMLLTWCVSSSSQFGDSVELEFKAYRLQQYDIVGTSHGSRSWQGKIFFSIC
ncbi:unnamed protein product [Onchocerca flexuosa]|uniref:Secreted protein n=1 Tax=Onchocerca flexuosa TaxID=387005 RepID=A0A183HFQ4_9BILA|nr:unnamed protein product [Onchocerca flexuosa]